MKFEKLNLRNLYPSLKRIMEIFEISYKNNCNRNLFTLKDDIMNKYNLYPPNYEVLRKCFYSYSKMRGDRGKLTNQKV